MTDWADEISKQLTEQYWNGTAGDEISVSKSDLAAALRKAREEGEAVGERRGRVKGLREAGELSHKHRLIFSADDNLATLIAGHCSKVFGRYAEAIERGEE